MRKDKFVSASFARRNKHRDFALRHRSAVQFRNAEHQPGIFPLSKSCLPIEVMLIRAAVKAKHWMNGLEKCIARNVRSICRDDSAAQNRLFVLFQFRISP